MVDISLNGISTTSLLPKVFDLRIVPAEADGRDCPSCNLKFLTKQDLDLHNGMERKHIVCPICSTEFLSVKGMKQHHGKKHATYRPYRCNLCCKRFRNIYASRIHKKQVHMHLSRQSCNYCGKSVYNKYSLSRHLTICVKKNSSI